MLLASSFIIFAIILLYFGADFTLESAQIVGKKLGLSALTIGMILVGFGTSLPEFFVGHIAGIRGQSGIALGSLVGSNIANMFLILGCCGIVAKLGVSGKSIREHLWVHLLLGLCLVFVLNQNELNLITASPLVLVLFIYLFFIFKDMKRENEKIESRTLVEDPAIAQDEKKISFIFLKMLIGFGMLYAGGELLVKGGVDFGKAIGISEYIISAIFIAFGTSFPELVTGLLAAFKKKDTDIIIGNIVGSNLFNCAFILGSLGIYSFKIEQSFQAELFVLLIGSSFLLLLNYTNKNFYIKSSLIFLFLYLGSVLHWIDII